MVTAALLASILATLLAMTAGVWSRALVPGALAATPATPVETRPRVSLKADRGFYDDAWALDRTGKKLALVQTDGDSFQRVQIFDLEGGDRAVPDGFELPHPPRALESLSFLPGASGFLLVTAATSASASDAHVIESLDAAGRPLGKIGPVSAFGLATRAAGPLLVTLDRRTNRAGDLVYVVAPAKLPALKAAGPSRTYVVGGDGFLKEPHLLPAGFLDGYSRLLTQRPGFYDKKKDVRQPDSQTVLDLLSGKPVTDAPIPDVYGWARTTRARRDHPNRSAFIQLSDTGVGDPTVAGGAGSPRPAQAGIELLDPAGRLTPLPLAVPFRTYDRFTLKDQEGPAPATVHFGLQVDPVNPDAVQRKKADQPFLDVYTVAVERPDSCRLRARVALDSQPVLWVVSGDTLVVFRRFKSFARGGDRVDVYDLAAAP